MHAFHFLVPTLEELTYIAPFGRRPLKIDIPAPFGRLRGFRRCDKMTCTTFQEKACEEDVHRCSQAPWLSAPEPPASSFR